MSTSIPEMVSIIQIYDIEVGFDTNWRICHTPFRFFFFFFDEKNHFDFIKQ